FYNLLFNPNGVPRTFLLVVAPSVLLLWLVGAVWGCVTLVRARPGRDQPGVRRVAWAAGLLACLPFVAWGVGGGARQLFGLWWAARLPSLMPGPSPARRWNRSSVARRRPGTVTPQGALTRGGPQGLPRRWGKRAGSAPGSRRWGKRVNVLVPARARA